MTRAEYIELIEKISGLSANSVTIESPWPGHIIIRIPRSPLFAQLLELRLREWTPLWVTLEVVGTAPEVRRL